MKKSLLTHQKLKRGKQAQSTVDVPMSGAGVSLSVRIISNPRLWMAILMGFADFIALMLSLSILVLLTIWFDALRGHHPVYSFLPVFYLIFAYAGKLYSLVGLNPVDEMRKLFYALSASVILVTLLIFFFPAPVGLEPVVLLITWFLLFFFILLSRWIIRILAIQFNLWGEPVAVMAQKARTEEISRYFGARPRLGIIPSLNISNFASENTLSVEALLKLPIAYYSSMGISTLLLDINATHLLNDSELYNKIVERFPKIIFMLDIDWLQGASFRVKDFEGISGFEVRHNSLSPTNSFIKRGMDITGALVLALLSFPIWVLTMIVIKLNAPKDPIFYTQARVGKDGKMIHILKFRTMVSNAEEKLVEYLAQNSAAKTEWDATQKLKNDPRVTKPGRWIREFSIDELPQLVNILKGEMSLVGPRPLPQYHLDRISKKGQKIRSSVFPGLSGMWQVSGRSNNGISELEKLDTYYISNWSIWLDIYVLIRTGWVVLSRNGAY